MADWDTEITTAYDLTRTFPCELPDVYSRAHIRGTKETTQAERDIRLRGDQHLKYLVYFPALLDSFEAEGKAMLQKIGVDARSLDQALALGHCFPENLRYGLPKTVRSENDVVTWCQQTIFQPALLLLRLISRVREQKKPFALPLFDPEKDPECPALSSYPHADIIPDGIFVKQVTEDEDVLVPGVFCTIEVKSQNALNAQVFDLLTATQMVKSSDASHTCAFGWPGENDKLSGKMNKFIVQVWSQLIETKAACAILTCHTRTYFFIRKGQTLYMSREYRYSDRPVFALFCLLAEFLDLYPENVVLKLPDPDVRLVTSALGGKKWHIGVDGRTSYDAVKGMGLIR
ncbi:hypothetical protein BD311DRAFT_87659 [Dichomitus squalens]|uniref:Uncharacterized protein n=1 Tax=Dichomitus squalens TaxID=114155 RepID=A0A4Q9M8C9_9APHY|nr:hypothetical protein BD311DRAFT_87659 [Dichomitus squalens]